jgi:sec-independent protein translocase protein TatA
LPPAPIRAGRRSEDQVRTAVPGKEEAMIGDLFDSPWKIAIVAVVVLVLFGSKRLPQAARSLGQSMRIIKTEVNGLHDDDSIPLDQRRDAA